MDELDIEVEQLEKLNLLELNLKDIEYKLNEILYGKIEVE